MDFTWLGRGEVCLGGHRPTHLGARPSQSEWVFPHKRSLLQTETLLSFISCPCGWSQTIPQVKKPDVEGWRGYTWSADVRPVECTAKFSETTLLAAYGREMNIQFSGNSSGGHSCSQHANCTLPQLETSVALCDRTAHFRVAFYCPRHKVHLCNYHAVESASWYATPVRWMDYLGEGEMLANRDVNNIWEK